MEREIGGNERREEGERNGESVEDKERNGGGRRTKREKREMGTE